MGFLSAKQTLERVQRYAPWSLSSLYAKSHSGEFVVPRKLGGKLLWPEEEVDARIAELFDKRDADQAAAT